MPNVIVIKNSSETFTLNFSSTQNATTQTTNVFLESTLQFFISFLNNKLTEKKETMKVKWLSLEFTWTILAESWRFDLSRRIIVRPVWRGGSYRLKTREFSAGLARSLFGIESSLALELSWGQRYVRITSRVTAPFVTGARECRWAYSCIRPKGRIDLKRSSGLSVRRHR